MDRTYSTDSQVRSILSLASLCLLLTATLATCGGGSNATSTIGFSLSTSPGSQSVRAGDTAAYKVTVTPAAMIGAVNLSTSALPTGVNAYFGQNVDIVNGQKTLFVSTTPTTTSGTSQLKVTASDSKGHTQSTFVTLTIAPAADFSVSLFPKDQTIKPGTSTTYTLSLTLDPNATGPVNLSTGPLPIGATASFSPSTFSASGTSVLTITAAPDAPTSVNSVDIVASDSAGTITIPIAFSIIPADFALQVQSGPSIVDAGGTFPYQLGVNGLFGETPGIVNLSTSSVPTGINVSLNPNTVIGQGTTNLQVTVGPSTPPAEYKLKITGQDASGMVSTTFPLEVIAGTPGVDVFLGVSMSSQTVNVGTSGQFQVFVSGPSNVVPTVTLDKTDVGASLSLDPLRPGVYQLVVTTYDPSTFSNSVTATITASDPTGNQSMQVKLIITHPPGG